MVVIGAIEPDPPSISDLVGVHKPVTVVLTVPLGTRVLIDAITGSAEVIGVQSGQPIVY